MGDMKKPNQRIMQNIKGTLGTLGKAVVNRRLNIVLISTATCLAVLLATPFRSYASLPCTNTVQNPFDSGPGSLRDALAKASDGETITFCPSVRMILVASPLFVTNSVT